MTVGNGCIIIRCQPQAARILFQPRVARCFIIIVMIDGMIDCEIKRHGECDVNADLLLFSNVLAVWKRPILLCISLGNLNFFSFSLWVFRSPNLFVFLKAI